MNPIFQGLYTRLNFANSLSSTSGSLSSTESDTATSGVTGRIAQAFDTASANTGASFQYLLDTARRESSLQPDAAARTSSARGLFQFIESTWLQTMKEEGASLGLGQYADAITRNSSGRYTVSDPQKKQEILALRSDPEISSLMAGAYTRQNADYLQNRLGRDATAGELYIAHFLGPSGASQLIQATGSTPSTSAADLFPGQASANRSIFYDKGREKTVSEVYADLTARHGGLPPMTQPDGSSPAMVAVNSLGTAVNHTAWSPALGFSDDELGDPAAVSAIKASASAGDAGEAAAGEIATSSTTQDTADRVEGGWRAADPVSTFAAMFRTDRVETASMAAAFWKGFGNSPTLFAVAAADDGSLGLSSDTASSAVLRASQPGQILNVNASANGRGEGPLDLSVFLKKS